MKPPETKLLEAAEDGNISMVRAILASSEIDLNATDEFGMTPLIWAAAGGHIEVVSALLALTPRPDIHAVSSSHGTALTAATHARSEACIGALLAAEGALDLKTHPHPGAFLWAIATGDTRLVAIFLKAGADANSQNLEGYKELPVRDGEAVVLLADLVPFSSLGGYSIIDLPLNCAVTHGHPDIVRLLLDAGADPMRPGRAMLNAFEVLQFSKKQDEIGTILAAAKAASHPPVRSPSLSAIPRLTCEHPDVSPAKFDPPMATSKKL